MKKAQRKQPQIVEKDFEVEDFVGIDLFGPHSDIEPGYFREAVNVDVYGEYVDARRGSKLGITAPCPNSAIRNKVTFDAGDKEFVIVQLSNGTTSTFRYCEIALAGTYETVLVKGSVTTYTLNSDEAADMFVSSGKVFIIHPAGNSLLEYDADTNTFSSRKMGLPAPQISAVETHTIALNGLKGRRVYAVELVYKDTTVNPNVEIISSGPNRVVATTTPEFKEGKYAFAEGDDSRFLVKVVPTLNDGTDITDTENSHWTHIRLYRSKDLSNTTNSNLSTDEGVGESDGYVDELFQVQEMDKATFLATLSGGVYSFDYDQIADDDVPFPLDPTSADRLELIPIPPAATGAFHRNRIWVSGVEQLYSPQGLTSVEASASKIYYSPLAFTQYSEQIKPISAIEADPGDGQKMIKLLPFREDLVGIKEGKTGRVLYGDPGSGWVTEDHRIGIEDKSFAQFVPSVGICAIVNDQNDFRIYGYDLRWHSTYKGNQLSRPIRALTKTLTPGNISFEYMNGKLLIAIGSGTLLVFASEQKKGWTKYTYPITSSTEVLFTYNEGRKAMIIGRGLSGVQIEVDSETTDYNPTNGTSPRIPCYIQTHRWQERGGRSLIEHRYLSVVAAIDYALVVQPYVNGRIWSNPFTMLTDPQNYPDSALREVEYQGYSEFKPVGNYIHYDIDGYAPFRIYSISLNSLVQRGQVVPGYDPFELLDAVAVPPWAGGIGVKDAGTEKRASSTYTANDAGDEDRTNSEYVLDDAGDQTRSFS